MCGPGRPRATFLHHLVPRYAADLHREPARLEDAAGPRCTRSRWGHPQYDWLADNRIDEKEGLRKLLLQPIQQSTDHCLTARYQRCPILICLFVISFPRIPVGLGCVASIADNRTML
uniref:Uncharacterized protein n=1 Tax=Anopheles melas TaxID=34690 RepID=A0A182UL28_9DIPT